MNTLRIATRESQLALWQAEFAAAALQAAHPGLEVELVPMTTRGDQLLDQPLATIGGKALFLKELEAALLEDRADIAVHSMKDVPVEMFEGLEVPVIMERHDPRDALISHTVSRVRELTPGQRLGTSSLRRQAQMMALCPGLVVESLRGNVNTRLRKLDEGQFDAIVLAASGLDRIEFHDRIAERIDPALSLPAVAQGAIGIECRSGDAKVRDLIQPLNHEATALAVSAERAFSRRLGGSCHIPLAGYAKIEGDRLSLRGMVASPDGAQRVFGDREGLVADGDAMGTDLAEELLGRGANEILAAL